MESLRPGSPDELTALLAWAAAEGQPLEICGAGTKRGFGHAVAARYRVELAALAGIVEYEPAELLLVAGAATPMASIEARLAQAGQHLAFEPPDGGPLFGRAAGRATLGGTLAANLSGPRRLRAGAARDHVLGMTLASGRGELLRAGGRVVKNVSGYDLVKLICGSWGTLAVATEIAMKVLPAPERSGTVLIAGLPPSPAWRAMNEALSGPHEPSAAAHLPPAAAARSAVVGAAGRAVTALRVEGPPASVAARLEALAALLAAHGPVEVLGDGDSLALWRELRDAARLLGAGEALWRLALPPAEGAGALEAVADGFLDWGGGLLWCGGEATAAAAAAMRALARRHGGLATLVRAPAALKRQVPVFHPQAPARAALERRIARGFDPAGILNPGRMTGRAR